MTDEQHILTLPDGEPIDVLIRRDKRLKKNARWHREADGSLLVRIPFRTPKSQLPGLLDSIEKQLARQKKTAARRTDQDLATQAKLLNRKHFNGSIQWTAIRWVKPMKTRLGSCTTGGATDGHIRISEEIKSWPQWVIDYIICHEMAHRLHPNHSKAYWETLRAAYPRTDEARGFIKGVFFSQGRQYEEE